MAVKEIDPPVLISSVISRVSCVPGGKEQIYPGGQFELHLQPFVDAIAADFRQMMPCYRIPIGTEYEEVGFGFNKGIITGILRECLGFDGIVCTDWGLISAIHFGNEVYEPKAWGVDTLSPRKRMLKILDAGADQCGGETIPELLVDLVRTRDIPEERVNISVRKLLREKFPMGLFDNPHVDLDHASATVGVPTFVRPVTTRSVPRRPCSPSVKSPASRCCRSPQESTSMSTASHRSWPPIRLPVQTLEAHDQVVVTSPNRQIERIPVEVDTHPSYIIQFASGPAANAMYSFDVWNISLPQPEIYGTEGTLQ